MFQTEVIEKIKHIWYFVFSSSFSKIMPFIWDNVEKHCRAR